MKELFVVSEYHVYGNVSLDDLLLEELDKLKKLDVANIDLVSLEILAARIKDYYGDKDDKLSLLGEIESALSFPIYEATMEVSPDTLFLEMVEDKYIEGACERFNETHDAEKVFEALNIHFLVYAIQTQLNLVGKFEDFYKTLSDKQKSLFIPPKTLRKGVLELKRALYQRWHNSLVKLLKIVKRIYVVKTDDTKAMVRQILKKKQFFERAAIICGAHHALDFIEMEKLFKRNNIELKWLTEETKKTMYDWATERKLERAKS